MSRQISNYIVSLNYKEEIQFLVVELSENSPFLYDRKRIKCSGNYGDVVLAKQIAEVELRDDLDDRGIENLDSLYEILKEHNLIEEIKIIGQKRKSTGDTIFENKRIEKYMNSRRRLHYHSDSIEFYKLLSKM